MDPVRTEVMTNRFAAIVEEASQIAYRTAHTTFVKMTQDYQVGLATPDGEFFGYPYMSGVTSFIGLSLKGGIDAFGLENFSEGDIVICNDPFGSDGMCTHTMDVHLLRPIFHKKRIIAFAWAFIHSSDIGGAVPGSVSPTNFDVFQEGIRLRAAHLYRGDILNQELLDIFRDNCRIPEQNWGDLQAMIAGLKTMEKHLHELCDKHGVDDVEGGIRDTMDYAEMKVRSVISDIPDGEYEFSDYIEGVRDPSDTIFINARLVVDGDEILLDFTGSDPQIPASLNFITGDSTHPFLALAIINYVLTTSPDIPTNSGVVRPMRTIAPRGTILNCDFPAAMGNRWVTVMRVYDAVLGCLNKALDGGPVTAGAGQGGIMLCASKQPETGLSRAAVVQPMIGGSGARCNGDGVDGVDGPFGFLRSTPVEYVEVDTPLIVRQFRFVENSIAAGYHRGGAAIVIDVENTDLEVIFTVRGVDRYVLRPWGTKGGQPGSLGSACLNPNGPEEEDIGKIKVITLGHRDVLRMITPAGGGYGDALDREPERIWKDICSGLLSESKAAEDYGVVFDGTGIDAEATNKRRQTIRAASKSPQDFNFGPERDAHDRIWPPKIRAKLAMAALRVPASLRYPLLSDIRAEMNQTGETVTETRLDAAVTEWATFHGGKIVGSIDIPAEQAAE